MVVVGGSYGGVELACNLATELGAAAGGGGKVEVTLAAGSEVRGRVGEGRSARHAMLLGTVLNRSRWGGRQSRAVRGTT